MILYLAEKCSISSIAISGGLSIFLTAVTHIPGFVGHVGFSIWPLANHSIM